MCNREGQYRLRVNELAQAANWWGSGGFELWLAVSESDGPVDLDTKAYEEFLNRAQAIPGWGKRPLQVEVL